MSGQPTSLVDVAAFVSAAKTGSFAAGGVQLRRSRSAVAKAVARLERRLGARLMTRSTRRLALTEDGRRFFARCATLLDELAAAEAEVAQVPGRVRGVLRLSAPAAYGRARVVPLVARFLAHHPEARAQLSLSDRIGDIIARGDDLAIRIGLPDALPPDLVGRVVDRLPHGVYAAPAYLERRGLPTTREAVGGHDAIVYAPPDEVPQWRWLKPQGGWMPVTAASRLGVDSADGVLAAALEGLGLAYLPHFLAAEAEASGLLVRILDGVAGGSLPVSAVYPSRRHLPVRVRAFLDLFDGA